jgi:hypothetical protein
MSAMGRKQTLGVPYAWPTQRACVANVRFPPISDAFGERPLSTQSAIAASISGVALPRLRQSRLLRRGFVQSLTRRSALGVPLSHSPGPSVRAAPLSPVASSPLPLASG